MGWVWASRLFFVLSIDYVKRGEQSTVNSKNKAKTGFIARHRIQDDKTQDLFQHLTEVSILTCKFTSKIGLEKHGELIGLLHDLGKASLEFQQYIKSAIGLIDQNEEEYVEAKGKKGKIDHSSAGAQVIYRYFSDKGKESSFISQVLALVISSHHSGLIDCISPEGEDIFTKRMNKPDEKTRVSESLSNLDEYIKQKINELLSNCSLVNVLNQRLMSMREEKDSTETFMFKIGLLIRFLFSCLIDADRLNTVDFEFPEGAKQRNMGVYTSWPVLITKLEQHLSKFECKNEVDVLRKEISNYCVHFSSKPKGLYQLTVPTGGGKTLSSLRFAMYHAKKHNLERIFYIIPYTSIIDQNAQTTREILEDKAENGIYLNNIVLEHHSNLTPEEENSKQKLLSENWDAPIVFTTMVQFLEALFGFGTRSARRMHQLSNSVIIFDEIQTLPVRCVHLFNLAIRFLNTICGSTVVLCTATQPLLDKITPEKKAIQINPEQQIMPDVKKLFKQLKRVEVLDYRKIGGWTEQEIAELSEQELQVTGSVLIIVNTKKAAINLFQQLQNNSKAEIFHLSTNMCPAHRMEFLEKIKKCLPDKKPLICVSTQLIEAGVDIDFGTVIRYLAGLDSIAQAAGRCNRNGTREMIGRVFVVNPNDENLDKLKDIKIARDVTDRILDEYKANPELFDEDILGLKAIEEYYQYYFYKRSDDMGFSVHSNSLVGREDKLFNLLSSNSLSVDEYKRKNHSSPDIPLRQSFMIASKTFKSIDPSFRGIIVPYGEEGIRIIYELCATESLEQYYRLLKRAQRFSINVFQYIFDELLKLKAIHEVQKGSGIYYLDKQFYCKQYGMSTTQANEMEFLNC